MKKFILPVAVMAIALTFLWAGGAAAQDATSTVNGTILGDRGGSHIEWTVDVPANTDAMVSVEYAPCAPPNSVALTVYSSDGQVTRAFQAGHCRKTAYWNTGSSETATVKLSYYEHGNVLYYVINTEGIQLTPVVPMADEEMAEDEMADEEMAEEEMAEEPAEEMAEEEMAEEEPVTAVDAMSVEGTVLGTTGGGHVKYDVMLTGGQRYGGLMTYTMDAGGVWPAVGFMVWGPDGVVAQSSSMHGGPAMVDFVAPVTGQYTIDVYNYHPGRTMMFTITGMPIPASAE